MNTKPKILFIYPMQFGYHTDSFQYCQNLKMKYDVTYVCFDQGLENVSAPGVNVIYLNYNSGKVKRLFSYYNYLFRCARERQFDIVFIIQFKFCFLLGLFLKAKVKILDYRSGDLSSNKYLRWIKNFVLYFDSIFYSNITVISEGVRDILHLDRKNVLILPLGGDSFTLKTHNYDRLDLLYVGHLHIRNIYETIEGIALFLARHENAADRLSYTIIGFGYPHDEAKIREYILKFNLENIVQFLGRKKYTDLKEYFEACNIGVSYVPKTTYYEHQPVTKTFEYANSGLYTIATATIENSKVINQDNGVLCNDDPESFSIALDTVYRNRGLIEERAIRKSLTSYQWEKIVNEILEPYFQRLLIGNASKI